MADSISNFATTVGFIVGFGVLLFVVRTRRLRAGGKVKYGSDGKPISNR